MVRLGFSSNHTSVSLEPACVCATDSMTWSLLSDPQHGSAGPGCRHGHSAIAHQSCMYLFGGLKGLREQRDFWKWNSTSCTWTSLKNKYVVSWVSWVEGQLTLV